jgi:hypothetical protein
MMDDERKAVRVFLSSSIIHHSSLLYLMYRKPRFLEVLHAIREEMSREADYDVDLFAEMVRTGARPALGAERHIRGFKSRAKRVEDAAAVEAEAQPRPKRRKRAAQ